MTVKIKEIIQDSVRYSVSYWKNILIFGIFLLITDMGTIPLLKAHINIVLINLISAIWYLFLAGYILWNVRCSLCINKELPKLHDLIKLFINDIKVVSVIII